MMKKMMQHRAFGLLAACGVPVALASGSDGAFVGFVKYSVQVRTNGVPLDQVRIYARFNGATDTVLNVFNFTYSGGADVADPYGAFYHKDNSSYNGGVLSKQYGTWSPTLTGSPTLNRPFDSYLVIGGAATATNTTNADPSWNSGGSGSHAGGASGWNRADLLNNGTMGWFNSSPPNLQGRVGVAPNTATDVLIGQFVIDRNANVGTWILTVGFNNGVAGSAVQFATHSFEIRACPTWYRDIDGDGIGYAGDGIIAEGCTQPAGYTLSAGDNCPTLANPNQADANNNGLGDVCEFARGDLNLDGTVDAADVPLFFNAWGTAGPLGDLNFDGTVNSADFTVLLGNWGTHP